MSLWISIRWCHHIGPWWVGRYSDFGCHSIGWRWRRCWRSEKISYAGRKLRNYQTTHDSSDDSGSAGCNWRGPWPTSCAYQPHIYVRFIDGQYGGVPAWYERAPGKQRDGEDYLRLSASRKCYIGNMVFRCKTCSMCNSTNCWLEG